jgi:hypothetical protein
VKRALILLAAAVLLAGCSDPPVEGVVTHKQHSDAYDYVTMQCGAYGTNGGCTAYYPVFNHMPASWEVCVSGLDKNGKHAEGCIEVGESAYGQYDEGSHYPRNGA